MSEKQLAANRRNAQKSTGPITPEGKQAVRFNALKHGLRARSAIIPGESEAEFRQLCDDFIADWQPRTRTEFVHVEQMALHQWILMRLTISERNMFMEKLPAERQLAFLDQISIQRNRLERSFSKTMHDLRQLQKDRAAKPEQPAVASTPIIKPAVQSLERKPEPNTHYPAPCGEAALGADSR